MRLRQAGLSLIELMIAITLGLILMTGVVQVFVSSKTVFSTQQAMSRIQESGRLAIDFLARDIRMAGFYGCFRPKPASPGAALQSGSMVFSGLHGNFAEGVRGYESIADLPEGVKSVGDTLKPLVGKTANVLVIRTANEVGLPVSKPNDKEGVYAYSPDPLNSKGCVAGMCENSAAVISDCFKARVFKVTGVPTVSGTEINFKHGETWGGVLFPTENFATGEVSALNTVVYFLAEGLAGRQAFGKKTNSDTALELLEGVEHMRLSYATNNNPTYRLATAIGATEWPNVVSVRIELVVRSLDNNVVESTQPYTFAGAVVTPAPVNGVNDRYLRQVFNATVGIRSRLL